MYFWILLSQFIKFDRLISIFAPPIFTDKYAYNMYMCKYAVMV